MHMKRIDIIIVVLLSVVVLLAAPVHADNAKKDVCPTVRIEAERLPDLHVPRAGHAILNVGGEVTVFGGHTTNFIPTPTAEYFKDGEWHLMPMAYEHDNGFALALTSGKVLIAGGHEKAMGIGQTWGAELYDPVTHTFEAFASLDRKRARSSAVEIDSGRVVIAGNWYDGDGIEQYDGGHTFSHVKDVTVGRTSPYLLRTAKDDAIVLGNLDLKGYPFNNAWVDCLHGEPLHIPLLEEWRALTVDAVTDHSTAFIGDEQAGDYSYLLSLTNADDSVAIALVHNGEFSLLPTDCPIPTTSEWGRILYVPHILADQQSRRAYLIGFNGEWTSHDDTVRIYVIILDYSQSPARLTLGYTDPLADYDVCYPVLTADGDILLAGGLFSLSNFKPSAACWRLHVSNRDTASSSSLSVSWLWLAAFLLAALLAVTIVFRKKNVKKNNEHPTLDVIETYVTGDPINAELMQRITRMMEEEQLFLNPDLKVSDLAERFGIHRNQVSECINSQQGCTFSQYVSSYRVVHAQQLMREHPDKTMATVGLESGFANEKSFYRTFRQLTGKSPKEWADGQY